MFRILNYIQYFLQRPFKFAMKKPNGFARGLYRFGVFRWIYDLVIYFLAAPLRLVNALWYDIVIYAMFSFKDSFLDVVAPHTKKWTKKKNFGYYFCWLFGLPYRLVRMVFNSAGRLLEGLFFTVFDVFVPTITMMHGTCEDSSIKISSPGQWLVGNGNFAGSGIYFTMAKRVALHYANSGKSHPVIIYSRVSLGKVFNLSLAPKDVYAYVRSHDGDALTNWGRNQGYTSFEWWRDGQDWWEYCVLKLPRGVMVKTWRIRVLYIYDITDHEIQRVWGGKAFWMSLLGG